MPRRRALRISLIAAIALLTAVVVVAVAAIVVVVRRPYPTQHGELSIAGLTGTVSVLRDKHGIPQIYADNADDLFLAQGYVQAQDRFFEMDWRRHITAGRLSELVGANEEALAADKVVRTLGWRQVAEQEVAQLDPTTRGYLEAYAHGVNDYLQGRSPSQISVNYTLLGLQAPLGTIEPWTATDSVAWFKAMAWDLRGNYTNELDRARIYGSVKDVARVEQLYPPYPYLQHLPIINGIADAGTNSSAAKASTGGAAGAKATPSTTAGAKATPSASAGAKATPSATAGANATPSATAGTNATPSAGSSSRRSAGEVTGITVSRPLAASAPTVGSSTGGSTTSGGTGTGSTGTGSTGTGSTATGSGKRAKGGGSRPSGTSAATIAAAAAAAEAELAALRSDQVQGEVESARQALAAVPDLLGAGEGIGSNSWAVSGRYTASGKPLLANDPHLAPSLPGIWYQMGLHCTTLSAQCPFDVAGFTFAGVPGVVIGHNNRIAWGMTNLGPDVTDFYLEQVSADGEQYLRDGKLIPMTVREETIKVAGASSVPLTIRTTVHGPVLSDVIASVASAGARAPVPNGTTATNGYVVSLDWTALRPGHDMQAVFAIDQAQDFTAFRAAAKLLDVPAQNMLYADVDGNIGYQAPGQIPIRNTRLKDDPMPADGTWPLPGWLSAYDWRGYVPADRLPWEENPADGYIVAANQPVTAPSGPVTFTQDWEYGFRAQRIRTLVTSMIDRHHLLTADDMQSIQGDTYNPIAAAVVPYLLNPQIKVNAFTTEARTLLQGWDFSEPVDSAPAAYFNAVWANLLNLTFSDELPEGTRPDGGNRWFQVVTELLKKPQDPWWDDRRTPDVVETRDEIIRQALVQARLQLTSVLGKDPMRWQWGNLHQLVLTEQPLGGVSVTAPLHAVLNRGPIHLGGGPSIVDAIGYDASSSGFDVNWAPSMRMIVDLASLDRSRWVNQTGESGHPGQANYTDQLDAWAHNRTFGWPFSKAAVQGAAVQTQVLKPSGTGG